jgi:hypothetical protein
LGKDQDNENSVSGCKQGTDKDVLHLMRRAMFVGEDLGNKLLGDSQTAHSPIFAFHFHSPFLLTVTLCLTFFSDTAIFHQHWGLCLE